MCCLLFFADPAWEFFLFPPVQVDTFLQHLHLRIASKYLFLGSNHLAYQEIPTRDLLQKKQIALNSDKKKHTVKTEIRIRRRGRIIGVPKRVPGSVFALLRSLTDRLTDGNPPPRLPPPVFKMFAKVLDTELIPRQTAGGLRQGDEIPEGTRVYVDSGYQGINYYDVYDRREGKGLQARNTQ